MTADAPDAVRPDSADVKADAAPGEEETPRPSGRGGGKTGCIPYVLLACVATVVFWEIMSTLSRRASRPYKITASTLASFTPSGDARRVTRLPLPKNGEDRQEPHVAAFRLQQAGRRPVVARLVHGYNMCDCMRIKGYEVELLRDTRDERVEDRGVKGGDRQPIADGSPSATVGNRVPVQVWRLTSPTEDRAIWVTSMLSAYDFSGTDVDTRSLAFPRVNIPDEPNYNPQGITLESLKHPVRSLRGFLNAHWNKSRCDWLTSVGLRKPAWASRSMFTLVSATKGVSVRPEDEDTVIDYVVETHTALHTELATWRAAELASR